MPLDRQWLAESVGLATVMAVALGVGLAWLLENRPFAGKPTVSALLSGAMVLPAPLLCYYLLGELGDLWKVRWLGLTAAGVVSALPFVERRMRFGFGGLNPAYGKAARSLGVGEWDVFARVELPLVWRALLVSAGWALGRLVLELGAALWIAGAKR